MSRLLVIAGAVMVCIVTVSCRVVCGDGHCECYKRKANCTNRGLTFIPRIPEYVAYLDLSQNNFSNLSASSFANVSVQLILNLNLKSSNLSRLSPNTFQNFNKLRTLELSNNPIIKEDLIEALTSVKFRRLTALSLNGINLTDIYFMGDMDSMFLKYIKLEHCNLYVYDQSVFSKFKYLTSVSARYNHIHKMLLVYSKHLKLLNLMGNNLILSSIPRFCNGSTPLLPNLNQLVLSENFITDINLVFECLPKLEILQLGKNPIKVLKNNSFSELPNLKILLLSSMLRPTKIMAYSFNNSKLQQLILANSHINFDTIVHPLAFKGLKNLKVLTVSINRFQYVSEEKMIELFGELNLLESISMGGCSLRKIPEFLSKLKSLKTISLYRNLIPKIPDLSFQEHAKLTRLLLDENSITTFGENTLSPATRKRLTELNLAKNPFICDCSLKWFIAWHRKRTDLFVKDDTHYICSGPGKNKGQHLNDIRFSSNECYLPFSTITAVLGISTLIITVVIICSVLYKMRWRVRHYIYMKYHRIRQEEEMNEDIRNYTYDAYIIHSEEDENWVVDDMIPCLENTHHLRLCVGNRDFQPGMYILENIDNAIQMSRNIVVVLSPSFVVSEWCQTEVTLAQSFVLDARRRPLLTVVLEEPDARNMRHSLHLLLRSSAYIMWGEEHEARELFWRRLVESLG